MSELTPPTRRRWFQFGLVELVIFGPILAVIFWQAVDRPIVVEEHQWVFGNQSSSTPGPRPGPEPEWWDVGPELREPEDSEIAVRVIVWTIATVAVWLCGRQALRRILRRNSLACTH